MKKYQKLSSKISFPNHRVSKNDELIYIGRYYSTIFVIAKSELNSVLNNHYPELILMHPNELTIKDAQDGQLPKYSKLLNNLLKQAKNRQKFYNK